MPSRTKWRRAVNWASIRLGQELSVGVWPISTLFASSHVPTRRHALFATARALRAALPERTALGDAERRLLNEWLKRLADAG